MGFFMKDFVRLFLDLFPRDRPCFPTSQSFDPPCDLFLPGYFNVLVTGRVQAIDQGAGQVGAFLHRQCQSSFQ